MAPILALSAVLLPLAVPASPPAHSATPMFRPSSTVSARATVSVRILHAARFGPGRSADAPGAHRRRTWIDQPGGTPAQAQLLEFE